MPNKSATQPFPAASTGTSFLSLSVRRTMPRSTSWNSDAVTTRATVKTATWTGRCYIPNADQHPAASFGRNRPRHPGRVLNTQQESRAAARRVPSAIAPVFPQARPHQKRCPQNRSIPDSEEPAISLPQEANHTCQQRSRQRVAHCRLIQRQADPPRRTQPSSR